MARTMAGERCPSEIVRRTERGWIATPRAGMGCQGANGRRDVPLPDHGCEREGKHRNPQDSSKDDRAPEPAATAKHLVMTERRPALVRVIYLGWTPDGPRGLAHG